MRIARVIFVYLFSISLMGAFASPTNGSCGAVASKASTSSCCQAHRDGQRKIPVSEREDASCVMQCCRVITTPSTAPTSFDIQPSARPIAPMVLHEMHSLTDLDSIFHPPRS